MSQLTKYRLNSSATNTNACTNRIDILTRITGVEFEAAWDQRIEITLQGRIIPVLGKEDLIHNKLTTGRPKDLGDAETLKNG